MKLTLLRKVLIVGTLHAGSSELLAQSPPVSAQTGPGERLIRPKNDGRPFALFRRPTRFLLGWPSGALFEADLWIPVPLWSRTVALRTMEDQAGAHRGSACLPERWRRWQWQPDSVPRERWTASGCTLSLVPHFVVRQDAGGSAPVRTPSFNPALEFSWIRFAVRQPLDTTPNITDGRIRVVTSNTRLAHYSNGQSGCLYTNQRGVACDTIVAGPELPNAQNGSFSTHYIEQEFVLGSVKVDAKDSVSGFRWTSVGARWYPPNLPGGMSSELARTYGRLSLSGSVETGWNLRPEPEISARAYAGVECLPGRSAPYERCRTDVSFATTFGGFYGLGVIVRHVTGWDYYNVLYGYPVDRRFIAVGIIFDHTQRTFVGSSWPTCKGGSACPR